MAPATAPTREDLDRLRDEFMRDAEGLIRSMAGECKTCKIPRYRCPECWAYTAKLYLAKLDRIARVEEQLSGVVRARPGAEPITRTDRLIALVAILRAARRPIPAADILVPGVTHPKSLLRLLAVATRRGIVRRTRKPDPRTHRPTFYYEPAPPATTK